MPSRINQGSFYALPQSPQIFKQILMISGFDRYFQVVRCFRDEDLRADRQPEFTQIDCEMSFVDRDDIVTVMEGLIARIFQEAKGVDVALPMQRMTYAEAIRRFGVDNPDLRFGLELVELTELVKGSGFKVFADVLQGGGMVKGHQRQGLRPLLPQGDRRPDRSSSPSTAPRGWPTSRSRTASGTPRSPSSSPPTRSRP